MCYHVPMLKSLSAPVRTLRDYRCGLSPTVNGTTGPLPAGQEACIPQQDIYIIPQKKDRCPECVIHKPLRRTTGIEVTCESISIFIISQKTPRREFLACPGMRLAILKSIKFNNQSQRWEGDTRANIDRINHTSIKLVTIVRANV